MKIALVLHPFGESEAGGLGRFAYMLAKTLIERYPEHRFVVYMKSAPPRPPDFSGDNWEVRPGKGSLLWLDAVLASGPRADAHVFFTPMLPLFYRPRNSIVFALDFAYLAFADSWSEWLRARLLYCLHAIALWRAGRIISISQATKESAVRLFRIRPQKITVVHIGFFPFDDVLRPLGVPEPYFLFAGVLKRRKNVDGVIRAFAKVRAAHPEHSLVVAGKKTGAYFHSLVALACDLGVESAVRFVGYVTDAQLAFLYAHARAFVFPSRIEGFGMPILEAMSAGVPVITSNAGSPAEIAGGAALLVDPHDPEDIANAMERIAADSQLRQQLAAKGRARAARFSWEKAASKVLSVIQSIERD